MTERLNWTELKRWCYSELAQKHEKFSNSENICKIDTENKFYNKVNVFLDDIIILLLNFYQWKNIVHSQNIDTSQLKCINNSLDIIEVCFTLFKKWDNIKFKLHINFNGSKSNILKSLRIRSHFRSITCLKDIYFVEILNCSSDNVILSQKSYSRKSLGYSKFSNYLSLLYISKKFKLLFCN